MLTLYKYQEKALNELLDDGNKKHLAILQTGAGKTAVMMRWLASTNKKRVLIVTTATKAKSGDFLDDADLWNGTEWKDSLTSFEVISWHKLSKWTNENRGNLLTKNTEYAVAFDEVQKAKAYSSSMSKAFLAITEKVKCWTGYTATPGDKWIDLMPYMVATKFFKHKTDFLNNHAVVSRFRGFNEIVKYVDVGRLHEIWDSITTRPDTSQMDKELPPETHKVIEFNPPATYKKLLKERIDPRTGEFIETVMGLVHTCRQICFTKEKQEWLADFIEGLGTNCVFFCNYIEEEEVVCEIAKKALPKGAKIWRIDGSHHEVPTADTIGKYDIVVAHYASGGEALNLQFMNYWVSVSPNYSLSKSVQARGRIRRVGQKHSAMFFYYLKTTKSIEEDIYDCLKNKQDFSEKTWLADKGLAE